VVHSAAKKEEQMRRTVITRCGVVLAILVVAVSCGRRETPEQRLERLRSSHQIYPVASQTVTSPEGEPTVLVDLHVSNRGADPLDQLTILVRIRGDNGLEKVSQRVTLDLKGVRPGVGVQMPATIPGLELAETDEVTVELEEGLPADDLRTLPEWSEVAPAGAS